MRPLSWLTSAVLGLMIAAALGVAYDAFGQAAPPTPTCEQQLEQAQKAILQLRKANAQSDFQAASLQEALMDLQKKQAEASKADTNPKAAEKK